MIDSTTKEPISVYTDGGADPYIMVPIEQLDVITGLLKKNNISFWVDAYAISVDGEPEITVINLGHGTDVSYLQRLLDEARWAP